MSPREPVREVAESGTGCNRDQAERGHSDACADVQAVQQQHEAGDRYGWNCA